MRNYLGALILLPLLSACTGGGANLGATPGAIGSQPSVLNQSASPTEAQSDAMQRAASVTVPESHDLLYVANAGNNSITVYAHDASGNTVPKSVIAGSNTGLVNPGQLAQDARGNLYVANGSSLLIFAHGANGNVRPIRKLAGSLTGIHQITAMTVDKTTGKIFIGDDDGSGPPAAAILRFPPNAAGNSAPFARSLTTGGWLYGFASDSTGYNLITTHSIGPENLDQGITTYVKQFANATSPRSLYQVAALDAGAVVDDPTTKTYLVTMRRGGSITRVAENTTGYGDYAGHPGGLKPAVISTITSDTCGTQLALGYLRNIYVVHSTAANCSNDAVYVYEHDANGNAVPIRILTGAATKLSKPSGIYEGM